MFDQVLVLKDLTNDVDTFVYVRARLKQTQTLKLFENKTLNIVASFQFLKPILKT
jgi:hypothetical protein